MKIALEVTEHNKHFIAKMNEGVMPEVEDPPGYFVFHTDDNVPADIIPVQEVNGVFDMCQGFMVLVD